MGEEFHQTTGTIDTNITQIHDLSLFWFGTGTSVKGVWAKLVFI
jgi:hypothetical protein